MTHDEVREEVERLAGMSLQTIELAITTAATHGCYDLLQSLVEARNVVALCANPPEKALRALGQGNEESDEE